MNIRKASDNDLDKILALNQTAIPHVTSEGLSEMKYYLEHASPFLVVEKENKLAGFMIVLQPGLDYNSINYSFFCNNYSSFDYVDRIVIAEEFRGEKIGTALYQYLFEESEAAYITCEVNLNPPNPVSMAFHLSHGFKQVAEQKTENGKKSVAMMIRKL